MIDLSPEQIKLLKRAKSKIISEEEALKHDSDVDYLTENGLLEPVYRPPRETKSSQYSHTGSDFVVFSPPCMIVDYQITAAGRAVLAEFYKANRRWRITTGIAWAALVLSAIAIIWQILERLFGV